MSDEGATTGWAVAAALATCIAVRCTGADESVDAAGLAQANEVCALNGGVRLIVPDMRVWGSTISPVGWLHVTCNNTAAFKFWIPLRKATKETS